MKIIEEIIGAPAYQAALISAAFSAVMIAAACLGALQRKDINERSETQDEA